MEQRDDDGRHESRLSENARNLNRRNAYRVSGSHNYSVEELAKTWHVSDEFVRRLFLREPSVVVFWRQRPGRRVYRTIRIPESVAARVHERMTTP